MAWIYDAYRHILHAVVAPASKCEDLKSSPVRFVGFEMASRARKTLLKMRWINVDLDLGLDQYTLPGGCSIYCSRTFETLFRNDIKWSAHGVLQQYLVYYICVQPCITILISYWHNKVYNDSQLFVHLSMLLQRFYSLILPNPCVEIAYNKYMSIYSG
jgi:hypothetical protein